MKRIIFLSLISLFVIPVLAYEIPDWLKVPVSGTFHMTVNSIKDNQFYVDEYGVWIMNTEFTATFHLNREFCVQTT